MKLINNYRKIHMIGIGGISMSGIALILSKQGYIVSGSNDVENDMTNRLRNNNINVLIGHNANNIDNPDLVVYTAAISLDNPELIRAKELNIRIMERAEFLGELTKLYNQTITISGTHGKTTTTSMISLCFIEENLDPTIQVGSVLKQINGNYRIGNSEYFVLEACEYVDSFLHFYPSTEIILNIEEEHMDYFKNINQIKNSFISFTNNLPLNGNLIINIDDENCKYILNEIRDDINVITYSIRNDNANIYAYDINFNENGFGCFKVKYFNEVLKIKLKVMGLHNISNACACIATCMAYNLSPNSVLVGLENFKGANRRFEFKGKINNNISVFDDYAHHPSEIKALLNSLSNIKYNKLWVIFQPHTFTRTKAFLNDFVNCFENVDNLIITDIYAAREINHENINSKMIVDLINKTNPNKAKCISDFKEIANYILENAKENDIILTVGAGTITHLSDYLIK